MRCDAIYNFIINKILLFNTINLYMNIRFILFLFNLHSEVNVILELKNSVENMLFQSKIAHNQVLFFHKTDFHKSLNFLLLNSCG